MKTKLVLALIRRAALVLLLSTLNLQLSTVFAQSTAFTYHGRLHDNGVPVSGAYDLRFTAYSAEVGGNVIAGPLDFSPVDVVNGLFTVRPDFGADVFTGPARWLHIEVRPAGGGDFTPLVPRQEVTSSPYAIRAQTAGNVASGAVTANQLNTGGVAPAPGQFLSYDGGNLFWSEPGVAAGNIFSLNGTSAYYNGGNVGIGTATPAHRLSLAGGPSWTANGWMGAIALPNASAIGWGANAGGQRFGIGPSSGGLYFFRTASDPGTTASPALYDMMITDTGNLLVLNGRVGIGTTTPASKLTVRTTGAFSAYGIEHTDGTVRLSTYLDAGYGAWLGTRSAHALNFYVNDGLPSMSVNADGSISMVSGSGTVSVGTPNAESGISIGRNGNRADFRFNGSSLKLVAASGVGPPPSVNGIAVTTAGNVGIGTDAPLARLDVRGTARVGVLQITGGADLAEPFKMSQEHIAKGSVVVIDEEHPGQLRLSDKSYDKRVAGIVSGANGVNPGISLQQEGVLEGGQNVSLSGRVYVQADASQGSIKPGDLLTTSDTPGHAMKVTDHGHAQGAILGKAMSALKEGKGMVLVLVTLQ